MSLKNNDWKKANERFLIDNLEQEGVVELPSGVQYKVINKGFGVTPSKRSLVTVHYRGTLINDKVFDDSYSRKCPEVFRVNEVIDGWQEALQLMTVGSKWMLYIPYHQAYGTRRMDDIPGYSTLVFQVELMSIS